VSPDDDGAPHPPQEVQRRGSRAGHHPAGSDSGQCRPSLHPRKQGREEVTYAQPLLEPILRDTLGVILYQEQIIEMAIPVAGMTPSEADRFRRAMNMSPTGEIRMTYLREDFLAGCLHNGLPVEVAEELFKAVEGFAAFGFRRSHCRRVRAHVIRDRLALAQLPR